MVDVGAALRNGLARTFERNGLLLAGAFFVVGLASTLVGNSTARASVRLAERMPGGTGMGAGPGFGAGGGPGLGFVAPGGPMPFAIPMPLTVALVLWLLVAVASEAVSIVAVRTLVSEHTDRIPRSFGTHNMALATVNGVVGGIVVGAVVAVGLVLLVVPGVFLWLSFLFVRQEIAVEDRNFVDAMADSWSLATGHRIELFALGIVVLVVGLLGAIPSAVVGALSPSVGAIVGVGVSAVTTVFGAAVVCRAYDQLRTERADRRVDIDPDPDPYA